MSWCGEGLRGSREVSLKSQGLPSSSSRGISEMIGIPSLRNDCMVLSIWEEVLFDLVLRGLFGVVNNFKELVFPASGDDGNVDTLVLVLRTPDTLISCRSLLSLLFLVIVLPLRGVTFRFGFVIDVVGTSSSLFSLPSGSDLNELRRVLRLCGVFVTELIRL